MCHNIEFQITTIQSIGSLQYREDNLKERITTKQRKELIQYAYILYTANRTNAIQRKESIQYKYIYTEERIISITNIFYIQGKEPMSYRGKNQYNTNIFYIQGIEPMSYRGKNQYNIDTSWANARVKLHS